MYLSLLLYSAFSCIFYKIYEIPKFKKTKQLNIKYRQINYIKSVVLMGFTPLIIYTIYTILFQYYINYALISIVSALYAATDMSSLMYFSNHHVSTIIHHVSVQVFYYYCLYQNFYIYSLASPIILYACFSTLSYLVNYRLSIRFLNYPNENLINTISLLIYSVCSLINWTVQLYYIIHFYQLYLDHTSFKFIYICIVGLIINDDIFLIKYLYRNYLKKTS